MPERIVEPSNATAPERPRKSGRSDVVLRSTRFYNQGMIQTIAASAADQPSSDSQRDAAGAGFPIPGVSMIQPPIGQPPHPSRTPTLSAATAPQRVFVKPWLALLTLSVLALLQVMAMPLIASAADGATPVAPTAEPTPDGQAPVNTGTPSGPDGEDQQPATPAASPPTCPASGTPILQIDAVSVTEAVRSGASYRPAILTADLTVTGATGPCGDTAWTLRLTTLSLAKDGIAVPPVSVVSEDVASSGSVSPTTIADVTASPILASGHGDGTIHLSFAITLPPDAPGGAYTGSLGLALTPDSQADAILPGHHDVTARVRGTKGGAVRLGTPRTRAACIIG